MSDCATESPVIPAGNWAKNGPIVVVGRGQSGTRFLAEALQRQGVFIGGKLNRMFDSLTWEPLIEQVVLGIYPRYDLLADGDCWHAKVRQTAARFLSEGYNGGPWGWKIGISAFIVPLLARVFPNLRVLHLIRDGRDVMLSRLRRVERLPTRRCDRMMILGDAEASRWWGRRLNWLTLYRYRNEFEMHAWVQFVTAARRYGELLGSDRYLELRYEDMCAQPVRTLDKAFRFAGLELTAEVEQFLRANARTDRIGKWRSLSPRQLASAMSIGRLLLLELGYESPCDMGVSRTPDGRGISSEHPPASCRPAHVPPSGHSPRRRIRAELSSIWRKLIGKEARAMKPITTKGYLVLGMHRSGTSCLAGLLETAGLSLGEVSRHNRHNRKGNLENKAVQQVNNAILKQFGGSWNCPPSAMHWNEIDARPLLQALETVCQNDGWVIKDPRMLLTLEAWLPLLARCQMVATFRHPVAVARSIAARDGMPLHDGLKLWTRYNQRVVYWHQQYQFPLLTFDIQAAEYLQQFAQLCHMLGLKYDHEATSKYYEPELVNETHDETVQLPDDVNAVYAYLVKHQVGSRRESPTQYRAAG